MGATTCKTKGIAIVPIIQALRANEAWANKAMPPALRHYLTDSVNAAAWYPDEDWLGLLRVLAQGVPADSAPEGPYVMFGRSAALRDVGDDQSEVPAAARTSTGGVYRQLVSGKLDPMALARRVTTVWSLYHDTGLAEAKRDPTRPNVIIYSLNDYPPACREVCEVNKGYIEEYGKLGGVPCKVLSIFETPNARDSWSLEVEFEPSAANLASIAKL